MTGLVFLIDILPNNLQNKSIDFNGIRTWIIGIEGEDADHCHGPTTLKLIERRQG